MNPKRVMLFFCVMTAIAVLIYNTLPHKPQSPPFTFLPQQPRPVESSVPDTQSRPSFDTGWRQITLTPEWSEEIVGNTAEHFRYRVSPSFSEMDQVTLQVRDADQPNQVWTIGPGKKLTTSRIKKFQFRVYSGPQECPFEYRLWDDR
jgi:hypothetical protein